MQDSREARLGLGQPRDHASMAAYGAAHVAKSLFWYGGEVIFAYYLTDFAGLPPAQMGVVLAVGLALSAGMDLLVGFGCGRWMATPLGAARLQIAGAVAAAAGLIAFLATPYVAESERWPWALVTICLFRAGFALYDVPQNTLMSLATADEAARSRVASVRIAGSGLASLAVAGLVGPLIAARRSDSDAPWLLAVSVAAAVAAVLTAWFLTRTIARIAPEPSSPPKRPAFADPSGPARLWPYLAMMVVMMLGPPLFQKLEPYFATEVLASAKWGGAIILAAALGIPVGQPLWSLLWRRLGAWMFVLTGAVQAAGGLIFILAPFSPPLALTAAAFLFGLGNGGLGVVKWGAFSHAAARFCPGRESGAFAAFAAVGKLSLAAGAGILAMVVDASRQDPALIPLIMGAGPVASALGMAALACFTVAPARRPLSSARASAQAPS